MTTDDWIAFIVLSLAVVTLGVEAVENPYRNNRPCIVTVVCIVFIAALFFGFRYGCL